MIAASYDDCDYAIGGDYGNAFDFVSNSSNVDVIGNDFESLS